MKYAALASDYDGTLAHDGVVDAPTIAALKRARAAGLKLLMVTGRRLEDFFLIFEEWKLFDRIIVENGALLYDTATHQEQLIADPAPPELISRLEKQGVPLSCGKSVVATVEPWQQQVLSAIHDLNLEWHIIFNKGSVMALPSGVNKATGLKAALESMGISPEHVVGVGDAENDLSFLDACGLGVAVANALPSVKAAADRVMTQPRGAGVTELINQLLAEK